MFPKKKYKRRVPKAKNNPKPTENNICWVCQKPYASTHEIFFGSGERQLSIRYGMQVNLCIEHHKNLHYNPLKGLDIEFKKMAQKNFELLHGHEKYMQIFETNYLDEMEVPA